MKTTEETTGLEVHGTGIKDTEAARKSRERIKEIRERNAKRVGVQNVAVDLVREARDK